MNETLITILLCVSCVLSAAALVAAIAAAKKKPENSEKETLKKSFDALPGLCRVGAIHIPVFCALGGLDKFRFVFFADCHAGTVFVDIDIVVVHPAASGHLAIFHQIFVTDPLACQHGTALREEVAIAF